MFKTLQITLLLFLFSSSAVLMGQTPEQCKAYHKGKFKISDPNGPDQLVKRTKKYQIETVVGTNQQIKMKIIWLNDCTYQLEFHSTKNFKYLLPEGTIITGKITAVTDDHCTVDVTANIEGVYLKMEMFKL